AGTVSATLQTLKVNEYKSNLDKLKYQSNYALDSFKALSAGLGALGGDIKSISEITATDLRAAYEAAIKSDFSQQTIDNYAELITSYDNATQALKTYNEALKNFIATTYDAVISIKGAFGESTTSLEVLKLVEQTTSLATELGLSFGNLEQIMSKFKNMSMTDMQEFLKEDTESKTNFINTLVNYIKTANSALTNLQNVYDNYVQEVSSINAQIAKLEKQKLKEQLDSDLTALKNQKTMLDKLKSIANELRLQVYGSSEIEALYNSSLEQVKKDYAAGNADAASFGELQKAANAKAENLKNSSISADQYKFEVLKLANQIQSVAPKEAYEGIESKIDKANLELKKIEDALTDGFDEQIKALKDNLAAITMDTASTLNSNKELFATLGGTFSSSFNTLANAFNALASSVGDSVSAKVESIGSSINSSNNLRVTANGAILTNAKDEYVNSIYLRNFGRSAEDYGLRYWSDSSLTGKELEDAMVYAGILNGENTSDFLKKNNLKPFADGGIVTRPTAAMIGEAGYPEAVIPLQGGRGLKVDMGSGFEKLEKRMENNEKFSQAILKNIAELNFNFKNVIDENGERLLTKAAV
ncbi:hypothetical protein, partial [Campylobacter fetus]|uniref:hypothetical protein n=1 Tax=Campylobacter fetus TaxID=196 RepID=UPI001EE461A2